MFLKIGRQLTGMNNNVCKYVKEFMKKLLFLFVSRKIKREYYYSLI